MKLFLLLFVSAALFAAEPVKNFALVNQEGKPFQLYDLKGKYVMVTFVYSRCPMPKMCPLTMKMSKDLVKKWKAAKEPFPFQVLAVTLDPAYDTPAVLKKYGDQHHVDFKHFTLATGSQQVLSDMASEFNVIGIPEEGLIAHNMKNVLLDPQMKEIKVYKENEWTPDQAFKDLSAAAAAVKK